MTNIKNIKGKEFYYVVYAIILFVIILFVIYLFYSFGNPLTKSLKEECLKLSEEERISKDCSDNF